MSGLVQHHLAGDRRIPPTSSAWDNTALSNAVVITKSMGPTVRITARLETDDFDKLRDLADANGRPLADLVTLVVLHECLSIVS